MTKLQIEKKINGWHAIVRKKEDEVSIYTEDKNKIHEADALEEEIKTLSDKNFIIDGELIWLGEGSSRRELMPFMEKGGETADDEKLGLVLWDITEFDDEDLTDKPLKERFKILKKLDFTKKIRLISYERADTKSDTEEAINKMKDKKDSEGAVIKKLDSEYKVGVESDSWVKFRKTQKIDVVVLSKDKVKGSDAWNYEIGIKLNKTDKSLIKEDYLTELNGIPVLKLGSTFNTRIKASKGDVLSLRIEEAWRHEFPNNKIRYSIHKPLVVDKTEKTSTSGLKDLDNIVSALGIMVKEKKNQEDDADEEGGTRSEAARKFWEKNWQDMIPTTKQGGRYSYQQHFRGLTEEESKMDFKELINKEGMSTHGDLRFEASNQKGGLFGFTVFLGESEDNADLPTDDKLLYMAKHPDEEKIEKLQGQFKLQQPPSWLDVDGIVSEPGKVGATSEAYAKFFELDSGTYKIGVAHKHLVEIKFEGDIIKGRALIMKAPVGGERKWLIDLYDEQEFIAQQKTLDEQVKELRKSKTDHKWLIWADPTTSTKPKKINIDKYETEEQSNSQIYTVKNADELVKKLW